ncbi:MAG: TolC family protein [Planctomycetota bacterium]|nr:TolC family protein [Planctomycetota bacterium]
MIAAAEFSDGPGEYYVVPPQGHSGPMTSTMPPPTQPQFAGREFAYGHSATPLISDTAAIGHSGEIGHPYAVGHGDFETQSMLAPYRQRADYSESPVDLKPQGSGLPPVPPNFKPWWTDATISPLRASVQPFMTNIESLTIGSLRHSPYVQSIKAGIPIQETAIVEAEANFDWTHFLESKYNDRSDPIGSRLTTGNTLGRFRDNQWTTSSGVRRKLDSGGQFEVSQEFGYQDNNSSFLIPRPQSTTRLSVSYTQPLLNQAGRAYNSSRIVLAAIDSRIAAEDFRTQLQDHLMQVTQAYWSLFQSRATYLQKRMLYDRALKILQLLESRRGMDVMQSQIVRAQAAVTRRVAEIIRAEVGVRNAETRIRMLVNPHGLPPSGQFELIPKDLPSPLYIDIPLRTSLHMALYHRPDVAQAMKQVKSASIRAGIAKHDLLPKLDLVLGTYVAGLTGETQPTRSFEKQFRHGEPGFSVGLLFEIPLGNRAAKARHARMLLELQQSVHRMHATIETALAEVEIAAREVDATYQEMQARYQALAAAESETRFLHERWQLLIGSDNSASLLLENLLSAQERLAMQEEGFVASQVQYALALTELKRTTGTTLDLATADELAHAPEEGFSDVGFSTPR